jgi:hypothetical protein
VSRRRPPLPVLDAASAVAPPGTHAHSPPGGDTGDGWTRRFAASPPRLHEMVELYRELGLEVRVEPLDAAAAAALCAGCETAAGATRMIYTRQKP